MKRFVFSIFVIALIASILSACAAPTEAPTATPLPAPTETATPEPQPAITLYYQGNAQFEIVSPEGIHVWFDVIDTGQFTAQPTANDVLLTTHAHTDHYDAKLAESFPGQQLTFQEGEITSSDVKVKSIVAAHNSYDPLTPADKGTNYIEIVDVAGLRIAHFGDIGQDALTDEQLQELGDVDIAITQFENSYSDMTVENKKGFNLMDQLKPKLIIPTAHANQAGIALAVEKWKGYVYTDTGGVSITKADIPAEQSILIFGPLAYAYQSMFKLPSW
ncbi:MAG: MBL fold metallo-hydrolase [Anaerolineales bacterium]|nr:MBL fold metallo-hydrolase [Anaerolineales bacterium]